MVGWAADSKVQSGGFSAGRQIGSIPLIFHKRCFPLCTLYSYKHVNQTKASTSFLVFSQPVTKRRKYKRKLQVFDRLSRFCLQNRSSVTWVVCDHLSLSWTILPLSLKQTLAISIKRQYLDESIQHISNLLCHNCDKIVDIFNIYIVADIRIA